jgi:hypothetical protein
MIFLIVHDKGHNGPYIGIGAQKMMQLVPGDENDGLWRMLISSHSTLC